MRLSQTYPPIRRYLTLALLLASIGISYADYDAGLAAYERQDYATALREFRPLAQQGDAEAQNNLGVMYLKGEGVAQDSKAAVQWYSKASEQGHASAQIILGFMYSQGLGVLQDKIRAHMWANLAASNGAGTELRELIAEEITTADIKKAQRLARTCLESNYKDC